MRIEETIIKGLEGDVTMITLFPDIGKKLINTRTGFSSEYPIGLGGHDKVEDFEEVIK